MPARAPAKVNVSLLSSVNVKVSNNITVKDYYKAIFSNSNYYTIDPKAYSSSLITTSNEKDKSANKNPTNPKFLISPLGLGDIGAGPSLILLGDAIICTPSAPFFASEWGNIWRATLPNYGTNIMVLSNFKHGQGPGWVDTDDGQIQGAFSRGGNTVNGQIISRSNGLANGTSSSNMWIPDTEEGGKTTVIGDFYEIPETGIHKWSTDAGAGLTSDFSLNTNQPFSFKYKISTVSPEYSISASSSSSTNPTKPQGSIRMIWGANNYYLEVFADNSIQLNINGNNVGSVQTVPTVADKNGMKQLTVYPLGNYIYVYGGIPSTNATINKQYVVFNLNQAVNIPASKITAYFDCGGAYFDFSPIVHYNSGSLTSPLIGNGQNTSSSIFQCSYIGKFGVGTRPLPITFPDSGDSDKLYSYLNGCSINATINKQQNNSVTYTLTLNVASPFNNVQQQIQQAHQAVEQAFQTAIAGMQNGTVTQAQATASTNAAISSFNQTYTNLLSSPFNSGGLGNVGNPFTIAGNAVGGLYTSAQNAFGFFGSTPSASGGTGANGAFTNDYLTNVINGIFGSGGLMDTAAKSLTKTVNSAIIASTIGNVYSPAVFYSQLTLVVPPVSVDLAPNPQIDNCDVMSIQVNQAVEQNKASITLNNRNACDKAGVARGKYTWIKGQNNFCGIKPITVQLGYADNSALNTVFTGYVSDRQYSRDSSNNSVCTLDCEDVSKKLRESWAVNLPFFDGWCQLAVIYYLAKEAGFADNEILLDEDPATGANAITIRSLLTGNPDTFTGGCFEGHLNDNPPGGYGGLGGDYLHMTLPLAVLGQESPNYNFNFGTSLWDCMQKIREFSNFYLYANNFGHIIYSPPKQALRSTTKTFVEVDTVGNYNEIKRRLDVDLNTNELRNGVIVGGITFIPNKDAPGGFGEWSTHFHKQMIAGFPSDVGDAAFAPYSKLVFLRNPKWEDVNLARLACSEILRRVTRQRITATFDAWGQNAIFPYHIININESLTNETGVGLNSPNGYVVAAHTLKASTENWTLDSTLNVESYDPATGAYDPNLPSSSRE